ncbi:hypothetical protein B0H16DRAFT_1534731 [Mycena metata]|uniref:Zn(2)-C6 fungal-type domain-containing protein n=1 Tax=Mycena metata TaxID=1033252 RepID=A0AAD7JC16_9AGAR|nr:hypothetical protein B0H16DRAFT_1534731 [Mycena metata]
MDPPPTASVPPPANPSGNESWPRRTSKACSNCRREKLRCSGERPCSGCARKSLQCLDGCDPCRRARARCERSGDGNGGCNRCEERDLECTAEQQQPIAHPSPAPVSEGPTSPERVRTACQNCRNDNKKCDNQRPCSRCVSRSEPCIPLPRGPKQVKTRCEGCRKRNIRCDSEDVRPCQNCVTAGTECVTLARQGRGLGTRVKAACVSCRRNKTRCDGGRPCASCFSRGKGPECREQACKRCGQDECSHRPRPNGNSEGDAPTGNESTPSTSTANQPPSPSASPQNYPGPISWANLDNPSIFGPPAQQGLAYMPPPNPATTDSAPA